MISILVGEPHQVTAKRQQLAADFLVDNEPFALERVNTEIITLADLLVSVISLPMLSNKKMVVIGGLGDRSDLQEAITTILDSVADEVHLVLTESESSGSPSYRKVLSKHPGYLSYEPKKAQDLRKWLINSAEELESELEPVAADLLIEYLGEDNLLLSTELTKLAVYPKIDKQLIADLVEPTPRSRIFDLLDAIAKGELSVAMRLYDDQRSQKVEPLGILSMIIWQVQLLVLAQRGKNNLLQVAQAAGMSVYPLRKASSIVRSMDSRQLHSLIDACLNADERIRSDFIDADLSIKFLIAESCQIRSN